MEVYLLLPTAAYEDSEEDSILLGLGLGLSPTVLLPSRRTEARVYAITRHCEPRSRRKSGTLARCATPSRTRNQRSAYTMRHREACNDVSGRQEVGKAGVA